MSAHPARLARTFLVLATLVLLGSATAAFAADVEPDSIPSTHGETLTPAAAAETPAQSHGPDILPILGGLVVILAGAKLGGSLFARAGQPAVLGELVVGVVLGNLGLIGFHGLEWVRELESLELLGELGVLFLLFQVGLHSNLPQLMAVGGSSLRVATIGVVVPMVLGYFCSAWFFPDHLTLTHWFVGATLAATSVGITARVLSDIRRTDSVEGRIILGAAVIDDVLGLIVLAVVAGIIEAVGQGRSFDPVVVFWIVLKAAGFLVGALLIGRRLSRRVFRIAGMLAGEGVLLTVALASCFVLAWLAGLMGLAPIIGAFAAGLILDELHYRNLLERDPKARNVSDLLEPLAGFLVPIFFVIMGTRVDLSVFGSMDTLGFAAVLTLAAVLGKQLCGLGAWGRGVDRVAIGLGMVPRGEVGLIFAGVGAGLTLAGRRVVDDAMFSAIVVMVAVTTLLTPPLLVWRLGGTAKRAERGSKAGDRAGAKAGDRAGAKAGD
jgi:Kef-type K+ transport system membrane component KefB